MEYDGDHISCPLQGASHPRLWRNWFNISHQGDKHNEIILPRRHTLKKDRIITYARIVVEYRAHKKDSNTVRVTTGGNSLKGVYEGELTTRSPLAGLSYSLDIVAIPLAGTNR